MAKQRSTIRKKFTNPYCPYTCVDGVPKMEKHEIPSKAVLKLSSTKKACGDLDKDDL